MAYVYIRSEPNLYTVGHYSPDGRWHPDSDFDNRDEARERVHWLNGGQRDEDEQTYSRIVADGLLPHQR